MDESLLRNLLRRLGDTEQPPSTVDLALARARGRKRLRWQRAGIIGSPFLAVGAVVGLFMGGVLPGSGGGSAASASSSPPFAMPSWCAQGSAHLMLSPATVRPGQLVAVIGAGIGTGSGVKQWTYDVLYADRGGVFKPWWTLSLLGPGHENVPNGNPGGNLPATTLPNRLFHFRVPQLAQGYYLVEGIFNISRTPNHFLCAPLHVITAEKAHR
jgi:hypothetical protein